jgi:hypothetical protein
MVFAVGACAVDEPELGEVEQLDRFREDDGDSCPGCGLNGNPEQALNYTFGQASRSSLDAAGAWRWDVDNPHSFCKPNTNNGVYCTLRPEWATWLRQGLTGTRVTIMTEMVRVAARQDFAIVDPGGNTYYGKFGLAPSVLDGSNYTGWEVVSAGLLALLNPVPGIEICLTTRQFPNHCAGAGTTAHESTMYGYVFRHGFLAISGGIDAEDPHQNSRYGNADNSTAHEVHHWNAGRCVYQGSGETRRATSCTRASNGQVYGNPVTVLMTPAERNRIYFGWDRDHEPIGY